MTKSPAALRQAEIIISGGALRHNLNLLKSRIDPRVMMMPVIKADAYGHGLCEVARLAEACGANMLGVAIAEEGIALRDQGITLPILVLGGAAEAAARAGVHYGLSQTVYDAKTLSIIEDEAEKIGEVARVHVKIDTGMTRLGIGGERALEDMLRALKISTHTEFEGIYTHFAEPLDADFTMAQNAAFEHALKGARAAGFSPIAHAAASAAMLSDAALWHDMVRPGIAVYGGEVRSLCPKLKCAQTIVVRPVRAERVPEGTFVSYDRTFETTRDSVIMTLPIGYGDGYPRILSGRAHALVRGRRAPIVGRVCMDMLMLDVTDIPGASMGDEVVLLGRQGGDEITPDELASLAMTNSYEIMLGFTSRLRRRYDDE